MALLHVCALGQSKEVKAQRDREEVHEMARMRMEASKAAKRAKEHEERSQRAALANAQYQYAFTANVSQWSTA